MGGTRLDKVSSVCVRPHVEQGVGWDKKGSEGGSPCTAEFQHKTQRGLEF